MGGIPEAGAGSERPEDEQGIVSSHTPYTIIPISQDFDGYWMVVRSRPWTRHLREPQPPHNLF